MTNILITGSTRGIGAAALAALTARRGPCDKLRVRRVMQLPH